MNFIKKIGATIGVAVLLTVGGVVAAAPASAAGGATVCGASNGVFYVTNTSGFQTFVYNFECRSGMTQIGPPSKSGYCYSVTGGTSISWCNSNKIALVPGRTYWVRRI